jgi:hypothetical protein
MKTEITLRITLEKPNSGVCFGVQYGKGEGYETVQKQTALNEEDLVFEITVPLKMAKNGTPQLSGHFIQGPSDGKFLYIDIGTYAGQADSEWGRRLKIPLSGMEKLLSTDAGILETKVPGKGKDGGPNCATVKPFDGWKPVKG